LNKYLHNDTSETKVSVNASVNNGSENLSKKKRHCDFRKTILIYIQQDGTLHSLVYLETAIHVSGGTIAHHQERKKLCLQNLVFVTPLLLSAAIVEELELVCVCCGWRT
jgi:hypothetical protein